jgi:hypothetical protein
VQNDADPGTETCLCCFRRREAREGVSELMSGLRQRSGKEGNHCNCRGTGTGAVAGAVEGAGKDSAGCYRAVSRVFSLTDEEKGDHIIARLGEKG